MTSRYQTPSGRARRAEIVRGYQRRKKVQQEVWRKELAQKEFFDLAYKCGRGRSDRYGLTPTQFLELAEKQDYRCANKNCPCVAPTDGVCWHVDHDHETGKVRGILCAHCNWAVGYAKDSPRRLQGLANYLRTHGSSK